MELGNRVKCKAYLQPVKDGAFIQRIEGKLTESGEEVYVLHPSILSPSDVDEVMESQEINPWSTDKIQDKKIPKEYLSPCEGAPDITKTYYLRREKDFDGIVVAEKRVITEAYIGVDTDTDWQGREFHHIDKWAKTTIDCLLVYYAKGKSRLVPKEDAIEDYASLVRAKTPRRFYCSTCGDAFIDAEWLSEGKWDFCPHCGRKLRK